ncbi:MAG TPA: deoxyribose-phosphate aldolase [Micromonosporaceae bacterium]
MAQDLTAAQVAKMIDHSILKPEFTPSDVREGCAIAARFKTGSVCVRPGDVPLAAEVLEGSGVPVCTVVGFPHGSNATEIKVAETRVAVTEGAVEIDMVLNIGRLRAGDLDYVEADIRAVVEAAGDAIVKVILENAYLTDEQKVQGCQASERAGAAFVKTSTGYAPSGATLADVRLMRATVSDHVQVKAAGGIRSLDALLEMFDAGATRFGASATEAILGELESRLRGEAPVPAESVAGSGDY